MNIKKNDTVQVIKGKNKGKVAKILSVSTDGARVIVEGLNTVSVFVKSRIRGEAGVKQEKQLSINRSNVMIVDPKTNKPTRVGVKMSKDGKKERITKKSGTTL